MLNGQAEVCMPLGVKRTQRPLLKDRKDRHHQFSLPTAITARSSLENLTASVLCVWRS